MPNKRPKLDPKIAPAPAPIFLPKLAYTWNLSQGPLLHLTLGDPTPSPKIAAFDLDGTLITTRKGQVWPKSSDDWKWWHASVTNRLKSLVQQEEYSLVIFSNQNLNPDRMDMFKAKVPQIVQALNLPCHIFAATLKDGFRKPRIGMWEYFVKHHNGGIEPDLTKSWYVGDAGGRLALSSTIKKDWTDTDRKWAQNVGLPFHTPEEFFLGQPVRTDWVYKGFNPVAYVHTCPPYEPFDPPLIAALEQLNISNTPTNTNSESTTAFVTPPPPPSSSSNLEMIIFVGPPGSGKSTFYEHHFAQHGYARINQDTLKTRPKCLEVAEFMLRQALNSSSSRNTTITSPSLLSSSPSPSAPSSSSVFRGIVVDNTSPSRSIRQEWIKLARKLSVHIRCLHFTASIHLCQHNDAYRTFFATPSLTPTAKTLAASASATAVAVTKSKSQSQSPLPKLAWDHYSRSFEEPSLEEGFEEIRKVNFRFTGTAEEKKYWNHILS